MNASIFSIRSQHYQNKERETPPLLIVSVPLISNFFRSGFSIYLLRHLSTVQIFFWHNFDDFKETKEHFPYKYKC